MFLEVPGYNVFNLCCEPEVKLKVCGINKKVVHLLEFGKEKGEGEGEEIGV